MMRRGGSEGCECGWCCVFFFVKRVLNGKFVRDGGGEFQSVERWTAALREVDAIEKIWNWRLVSWRGTR
jgi:hypothetical protein